MFHFNNKPKKPSKLTPTNRTYRYPRITQISSALVDSIYGDRQSPETAEICTKLCEDFIDAEKLATDDALSKQQQGVRQATLKLRDEHGDIVCLHNLLDKVADQRLKGLKPLLVSKGLGLDYDFTQLLFEIIEHKIKNEAKTYDVCGALQRSQSYLDHVAVNLFSNIATDMKESKKSGGLSKSQKDAILTMNEVVKTGQRNLELISKHKPVGDTGLTQGQIEASRVFDILKAVVKEGIGEKQNSEEKQ